MDYIIKCRMKRVPGDYTIGSTRAKTTTLKENGKTIKIASKEYARLIARILLADNSEPDDHGYYLSACLIYRGKSLEETITA